MAVHVRLRPVVAPPRGQTVHQQESPTTLLMGAGHFGLGEIWITVPDLGDDAPTTGRQAHGDELWLRELSGGTAVRIHARRLDGVCNQLTHQQPRRFDAGTETPAEERTASERSCPIWCRRQCRQRSVETKRPRPVDRFPLPLLRQRFTHWAFLRVRLPACNWPRSAATIGSFGRQRNWPGLLTFYIV
jgi:hypothetical protein